jgi:HK97 family phage prohead protease
MRQEVKKASQLVQTRKTDTELYTRDVVIDYRNADLEARTVPCTFSSDTPIMRGGATETLAHGPENIDLARAADGLPLLYNHDPGVFLGAVRGLKPENGKLGGTIHFSNNTRAQEVMQDVAAGLLPNMSVGFKVNNRSRDNKGNVTITNWTPHEASITPIPADISVGINRNEGPIIMDNTASETREEARAEQLQRVQDIHDIFNTRWAEKEHLELRDKLVLEGATPDEARQELLSYLGLKSDPVNQASPNVDNRTVDNDWTKRMVESICVRAGTIDDKDTLDRHHNNEFAGMTFVELAREYLQRNGESGRGSAMTVITKALNTRAVQDTTDFTQILMDASHNNLLRAYWDAPETWRTWASTSSVPDFKINNRSNLSEFDTLPVVAEGANYTDGSFTNLSENITLATYGMLWHVTRESLVNDSLSAFSRVPTAMGLAAARTIGDLVYGVLTTNPLMNQDATALFAAGHSNDVAVGVGGGPPDAETVQAGKVAMALQTGPKTAATLGIMPRYGICPVALQGTFDTLMAAQYNPASTAGTLEPNVVQQLLTVVADHRLDAASSLVWYMAASPQQWDTVDVAFLNGNQAPYQERKQQDIITDNITYKVRIDAAAAPMDFRGLYRNAGAAA